MTGVVDYGAGNLKSVCNALTYLGAAFEIVADSGRLAACDRVILPGVGAFPSAMEKLERTGFVEPLRRAAEDKPLLGICLGMQLLFEKGFEFRETGGLGLLPGYVDRIPDTGLPIPHVGWNGLEPGIGSPLLAGVAPGAACYFVHSYMAFTAADYVAASADYGLSVPALVQRGHIFGAQFHPEKSSRVGLRILSNFLAL